ncbi:MAG: hypothetical protein VKK99_06885 [Cyanobacteriota bacterium]|nr:hypothetical protein [Cyanobacteriota bacterium]
MSAPEQSLNGFKTIADCFGVVVRLTQERMVHILEHPEMKEMGAEIEHLLAAPQIVRRSRSDESVRLFYAFYPQTLVGAKWVCVVVKYVGSDAFVITAYLTDKPKLGAPLWPIS